MSKIDEIVNGYASNELTYIDREGEHKINIDEFVKTGSANVLQKLNRTEQVLLKVANAAPEKLKWVNDYAMMKVIDKLYEKVDDLSAGLIEKDTEIERLNNEATASRVAFETADGIPREEAEKLVQRIEGMEADEQIHLSQIDQLIKERDEALEHESIAIKQMETKTDEYVALEERFNKSVEAYKTLKAENTELNNKMTNSSQESDTLYNNLVVEYDKLNVEYNDKVSEVLKLKGDIENALTEIQIITERHNNSITEYEHTVEQLNVRIDNIMEENEKLTNKIAELQQMKTDIEQELNSYAGEFEKASARCQAIDSRNEELNLECENQKGLIAKLEEQYNDTCQKLDNINTSYTGLFNDYNNVTTSYTALMSSLDESTRQLNDMIDKLRTSDDNYNKEHNKNDELTTLNESLQGTINSQINEINDFKVKLEESMKECAVLKGKIKHTENYEEMYNRYDNAIKNFLETLNLNTNNGGQQQNHKSSTQHRMGDNQVVNFNLGQ